MFASLFSSVLVAATTPVAAFDAEAWLAKREILAREAERLQGAYSNCVARLERPSENVKIPVETFSDGSIKTFLSASKVMLFLDTGLIWADGVTVEQLSEKGAVPSRIEATTGVVDRETKSGWAEGAARLTHEATTFDGEGVYFSSPEGYVAVHGKTRVVSKDLRFGDPTGQTKRMAQTRDARLLGGTDESLVITSVRCDLDRDERVVLFDGDVRVLYAKAYTLDADRVFVFLSEANDLARIEATGHVSITNEQRSGSCARAVFRREVGEIEMFGEPGGEAAHLQEADGNAVDGSRIKFWLDAEQVEVVDSVLTVKTTKGDLKKL